VGHESEWVILEKQDCGLWDTSMREKGKWRRKVVPHPHSKKWLSIKR
jgi:hypothetical protein